MDRSSRKILIKAKREQQIKKRVTVLSLSLFIVQLGLMIFGINHPYENAVLWGLLVGGYLVSSEIFGITKIQLIAELEKAVNESPETFDIPAHYKE